MSAVGIVFLAEAMPIFTLPRVLGEATGSAIVRRPVAGWEQAQPVIEAMEAEHGLTAGRRYKVAEMVRPAHAAAARNCADR